VVHAAAQPSHDWAAGDRFTDFDINANGTLNVLEARRHGSGVRAYLDIPPACFRGGTLTGPQPSAAQLHGFLGYVMRCAMTHTPHIVFGYGGKQVRAAIHCKDLIDAFDAFWRRPGWPDG
jgi:nucleoside-diphosphate-sugar epimerase